MDKKILSFYFLHAFNGGSFRFAIAMGVVPFIESKYGYSKNNDFTTFQWFEAIMGVLLILLGNIAATNC
jgi:hypothetical protein